MSSFLSLSLSLLVYMVYYARVDPSISMLGAMWNIVKRSRVQWNRIVISKCDFERAAQVFCRRRADSTVFSKRCVDIEPSAQCFRSAL